MINQTLKTLVCIGNIQLTLYPFNVFHHVSSLIVQLNGLGLCCKTPNCWCCLGLWCWPTKYPVNTSHANPKQKCTFKTCLFAGIPTSSLIFFLISETYNQDHPFFGFAHKNTFKHLVCELDRYLNSLPLELATIFVGSWHWYGQGKFHLKNHCEHIFNFEILKSADRVLFEKILF